MQKSRGERAEEIVRQAGLSGEVMRGEIEHRLGIIDFWKIHYGAKILEIGCGQGETTAALAYTVGDTGFVYGIDLADESYGVPETLGEARDRLMTSPLGERINMDFGINILRGDFGFDPNSFDFVILSHCLWYLTSQEELHNILYKIRPWAKRLCIAEWDPRITSFAQYGHFMSAEIQAVCESYHLSDHFNIRTMFYPKEIENAVGSCGWDITSTGRVESADVHEPFWEADILKEIFPPKIIAQKNMPSKLKRLLLSQINALPDADAAQAMDVFALTAERL